ncbi:hypothetical protein [Yinghuangia seranimata]|uniref:hypothetical protein n=1 Tax=Yinghuangia seranimata TaxID=408067 RepID=UPI00248B2647|nr:hypothetical protein [Yinghuangia seranimata]MDI2132644.1 hypothetical protein [Yinghuangia seranimata]
MAERPPQRGIPDGALIGVLVLLVGGTAATWLSTGLAGLAQHQAWPDGVRFGRSGRAIRELLADPGDMARAWPGSPPEALPSPTWFWTVFGVMVVIAVALAVCALMLWVRLTERQGPPSRAKSTVETEKGAEPGGERPGPAA